MKLHRNIVLHLLITLFFVICINAACDVKLKCELCTKSGCNYLSCNDANQYSICTNDTNISCPANISYVTYKDASQCPPQNVSATGETGKDHAVPSGLPSADPTTVATVDNTTDPNNATTTTPTPTPSTASPAPNSTTSTTPIPTPPTTTVPNTTTIPTTTTEPPTVKTTVTPIPYTPGGRRFDAPSFFGGIILALGLVAIACICYKFYRARTEHNYHTLRETLHM